MNASLFFRRQLSFTIRSRRPYLWVGIATAIAITAVVSGVFVGLALTGSKSGVYRAAVVPVSFLAVVCLVAVSRNPVDWGAPLILIAALFLPFYVGTGSSSVVVDSLIMTMAVSGLWIFRLLLNRDTSDLMKTRINFPLIGFILVVIVSLVIGIVFRDPYVFVWDDFLLVQLGSTAVFVMLPIALMLVANEVKSAKTLRLMIGLTLLAAFLGYLARQMNLNLPIDTSGILPMWFISFSLSFALFYKRLALVFRFALIALAAAWFHYGFAQNISWVAGWLPGLIAIGVLAALRSKRLFLLFVLALLVLIGPNQDYYLGSFVQREANESLYTRVDAFEVNWQVTQDHLLFGTGPAGYTVYYMTYFPNRAMATHNNVVDILSEVGLVGLAFFLWMILELVRAGLRVRARVLGTGGFEESLLHGALAGLGGAMVIMLFGDWMIPFAYTQTIAGYDYIVPSWLFMGMIIVLDQITSPQFAKGQAVG